LSLIFFSRIKSVKVVRLIVLYSILFFLLLLSDEYLSTYYRHVYSTFYTTVEYLSFAFIIWFFVANKKIKAAITFLSIAFIIFQIFYYFFASFKRIDSVPIGIETILILTFLSLFFYEQFQNTQSNFMYSNAWFWIVIGIMLYLSCSFFFNILASVDLKSIGKYWYFTYIFEIIKNILFSIGILIFVFQKNIKEKKNNSIPYLDML
jgi:hypothetical protein